MGAMLWKHVVVWQPDADAALRELQDEEFKRKFYFKAEVERWRSSAEQSLRAVEADGDDRFGLLAIYSRHLKRATEVASKPIPATTAEQIKALRSVLPDGFGSVLDVTATNEVGGIHVMRLLTTPEMVDLFGTATPTLDAAEENAHRLADKLGRGESVAFPLFDDQIQPTYWFFFGYSAD